MMAFEGGGLERREGALMERAPRRRYVGNGFSLNMVNSFPMEVSVREVSVEEAASFVSVAESVVGHADTAAVMSSLLGVSVALNRATVALEAGDQLLVGQYSGPRMAEGTKELPAGATIKWLLVTIR